MVLGEIVGAVVKAIVSVFMDWLERRNARRREREHGRLEQREADQRATLDANRAAADAERNVFVDPDAHNSLRRATTRYAAGQDVRSGHGATHHPHGRGLGRDE